MKAQFFIISSVIIIYIIVLIFQYLAGFSEIRTTTIEEEQDVSYIFKIKDSFNQGFIISNYTNGQDLNKIVRDYSFTDSFFRQELSKKGIMFNSNFIIFSESFDGGTTDRWDHTSIINGATISVLPNSPFGDNYANFTTFGSSGLQADALGINRSLSEVYAAGYFRVTNGLPLLNEGDRFSFIYFGSVDPESTMALAEVIHTPYGDNWALRLRNGSCSGSSWSTFNNTSTVVEATKWYFVELYWKKDTKNGTARMWVDGQLVGEIKNQNTSDCGDAYRLRVGINNASSVQQKLEVHGDCIAFGSKMIEKKCYSSKEKYFIFSLKTSQLSTETEFSPQGIYQRTLSTPPPMTEPEEILWFKFNEANGTTIYDSTGNGYNGIFSGDYFNDGITYSGSSTTDLHTTGWFGKALEFDSSNDFANVSYHPSLNFSELTVTAWIYPHSWGEGGYGRIVEKTSCYIFYVSNDNGIPRLKFYYWNSSGSDYNTVSNDYSIESNSWQHVAVTYNTTHIVFYVNGTQASPTRYTTARGPLRTNSNGLYIGNSRVNDKTFDGIIDELRIWNRTLNQSEIKAEMDSSRPVKRPAAAWSFEEESGAEYINDTHNWVKGIFGSALSFDGNGSFVSVADIPSGSLTLMAWINPTNIYDDERTIVSKWGSDNEWIFRLHNYTTPNPAQLHFYITNTTGNWEEVHTSNANIYNNSWYHVAMSYNRDNGQVKFYSNGTLLQPYNLEFTGQMRDATDPVRVGKQGGGSFDNFTGTVDEVKIFNRVLSDTEINTEMNTP